MDQRKIKDISSGTFIYIQLLAFLFAISAFCQLYAFRHVSYDHNQVILHKINPRVELKSEIAKNTEITLTPPTCAINTTILENKTIIVLYYVPVSSFMGKHMLGPPPKCNVCNISCNFTEDMGMINKADGLVFHVPTFHGNFPKPKPKGQKWIGYSMESEEIYEKLKSSLFMSHFDWTMTYKLDSDIIAAYFSSNLPYLMQPPIVKNSSNVAVFIASNCAPKNNRTGYVLELQKYLPVHSYGRCIHNKDFPKDLPSGGKQKFATLQKYKFTLAFENHSAKDYVTEKFFHALAAGSVPVYMGAPNIYDFAPSNHSFVNAADFRSPKELADYLLFLSNNETEYQKYLSWKVEGPQPSFLKLIERQYLDARCRLCLKLAEDIVNRKIKQE